MDVLIRDEHSRVLVVAPTYKPDWDTPGGMAEANEAPRDAIVRETGRGVGPCAGTGPAAAGRVGCPHGPWDDQLVMIFDGGMLTADRIERLVITDAELAAFAFVPLHEARRRLRPTSTTGWPGHTRR